MNRSQTLIAHFESWQEQHFSTEVFYRDGIINEQQYDQASLKILFIAKEPNATNHKGEGLVRSFCEEWNNEQPDYGFALRIADWTYGILNDFPVFSCITDALRYEYLKKIAFMNLKKSGGKGKLDRKREFETLVKEQMNYIQQQIHIIQPDICILSVSHRRYLKELLFPDARGTWTNCGYAVDVARSGKCKLIDFYHPSSRNVAAASYSLLQNVVQSAVFGQL